MSQVLPGASPEQLIVAVDDDQLILELVARGLRAEGFAVLTAKNGTQGLALIRNVMPDLVISDVDMPEMDGLELVRALRSDPELTRIPVVFLSSMGSTSSVIAGLELGGDDYVTKPFQTAELVARVRSKLARVPVPVEFLAQDMRTGLVSESRFLEELTREFSRAARGGSTASVVSMAIHEIGSVRLRLGPGAADKVLRETARRISQSLTTLELVGRLQGNVIGVLMPETDKQTAGRRLDVLVSALAGEPISLEGQEIFTTPVVGFCESRDAASAEDWVAHATVAREYARTQLTLQPTPWDSRVTEWAERNTRTSRPGPLKRVAEEVLGVLRLPFQILMTFVLGMLLPFLLYFSLDQAGYDITWYVYIVVVVALLGTGALIWAEGILAFFAPQPPDEPGEAYPQATAIIAAYLPNEAATILQTIDAFLELDYPGGLQVILAYNTPSELPVEKRLAELATLHTNFLPYRVDGSQSKAQNVNAALEVATGRFIGLFDADHLPQMDSFERAWRWLSNGYDVVQGHCMVRNGDASWLAQMVAVEFEAIYAVSHPGRAVLHGFGIFGGSNGYWLANQLHRMRMYSSMLTEDIDSSMRVVNAGGRIASDPGLISAELATTTVKQLWNQRMRWAQGWFEVSLRHLIPGLRSRHLSFRQKLGLLHLLWWRELYPWLSIQVIPIVAVWVIRGNVDWVVPIFVLTTVLTMTVGPGQTILAYFAAAPPIRRHRAWFVAYLFFSSLVYTEFKNLIVRVAQMKHFAGERRWRVTPRTVEEWIPSVAS